MLDLTLFFCGSTRSGRMGSFIEAIDPKTVENMTDSLRPWHCRNCEAKAVKTRFAPIKLRDRGNTSPR